MFLFPTGFETLSKKVDVVNGNRTVVMFSLNQEVNRMSYHDYVSMHALMANISMKCPQVTELVR